MTKRNLTLGSASGKLGSVVYMRRRGQQIARLLVPSPRDPRTLPQCGVRAAFANYVNHWRAIRQYVEPSWRGVSRYGSVENAFYKHSRGQMPAINKTASRLGQFMPTKGLVTYGALPVNLLYDFQYGWTLDEEEDVSGVFFLNSLGATAPTTAEGLFSGMKSWGVGVAEGDYLHVMLYSWYVSRQGNPMIDTQSSQPSIQHVSVLMSAANTAAITSAIPFATFHTGLLDAGGQYVYMQPNESLFPSTVGNTQLMYAVAMWIERPSRPRYARFSRSRWALNGLCTGLIAGCFPNSLIYENIAATYQ